MDEESLAATAACIVQSHAVVISPSPATTAGTQSPESSLPSPVRTTQSQALDSSGSQEDQQSSVAMLPRIAGSAGYASAVPEPSVQAATLQAPLDLGAEDSQQSRIAPVLRDDQGPAADRFVEYVIPAEALQPLVPTRLRHQTDHPSSLAQVPGTGSETATGASTADAESASHGSTSATEQPKAPPAFWKSMAGLYTPPESQTAAPQGVQQAPHGEEPSHDGAGIAPSDASDSGRAQAHITEALGEQALSLSSHGNAPIRQLQYVLCSPPLLSTLDAAMAVEPAIGIAVQLKVAAAAAGSSTAAPEAAPAESAEAATGSASAHEHAVQPIAAAAVSGSTTAASEAVLVERAGLPCADEHAAQPMAAAAVIDSLTALPEAARAERADTATASAPAGEPSSQPMAAVEVAGCLILQPGSASAKGPGADKHTVQLIPAEAAPSSLTAGPVVAPVGTAASPFTKASAPGALLGFSEAEEVRSPERMGVSRPPSLVTSPFAMAVMQAHVGSDPCLEAAVQNPTKHSASMQCAAERKAAAPVSVASALHALAQSDLLSSNPPIQLGLDLKTAEAIEAAVHSPTKGSDARQQALENFSGVRRAAEKKAAAPTSAASALHALAQEGLPNPSSPATYSSAFSTADAIEAAVRSPNKVPEAGRQTAKAHVPIPQSTASALHTLDEGDLPSPCSPTREGSEMPVPKLDKPAAKQPSLGELHTHPFPLSS